MSKIGVSFSDIARTQNEFSGLKKKEKNSIDHGPKFLLFNNQGPKYIIVFVKSSTAIVKAQKNVDSE